MSSKVNFEKNEAGKKKRETALGSILRIDLEIKTRLNRHG